MLTQESEVRVYLYRPFCRSSHRFTSSLTGLLLLAVSAGATAADQDWFFLRTQNPFLQIYGLPPFQSAALANRKELQYRATLDIANHADSGDSQDESVIMDGESYFFTLSARYGLKQWLEVGFDLPVIWHSGGAFDNAIERWHKIWGLSNSGRSRPSNELLFRYSRQGSVAYELSSSIAGLGDLQLTAAVPLVRKDGIDGYAVSLRSSLKLPTGDADDLLGSGATDVSLGLYASKAGLFAWPELTVAGFAGMLFLGEGDVFADIQERTVAFGGIAGAWQANNRLSLAVQVYGQDSYLKSGLNDIGGNTVQAAFGGTYHVPKHGITYSLALVEDLVSDTVPDVALHLSIRWQGGNQKVESR